MIAPQVAELIAADRIAEWQRHAATARLAAIARCCRLSTWTRAARHLTRTLTRLRAARSVAGPCCPGT